MNCWVLKCHKATLISNLLIWNVLTLNGCYFVWERQLKAVFSILMTLSHYLQIPDETDMSYHILYPISCPIRRHIYVNIRLVSIRRHISQLRLFTYQFISVAQTKHIDITIISCQLVCLFICRMILFDCFDFWGR